MCLICEEEDLYFLYLERIERAQKAARGERATANPAWLWSAPPVSDVKPAPVGRPRAEKPIFACDAPNE